MFYQAWPEFQMEVSKLLWHCRNRNDAHPMDVFSHKPEFTKFLFNHPGVMTIYKNDRISDYSQPN
jgi:hypothetical protein